MELRPAAEEAGKEASKPEAEPNQVPHVSPLESYHGVSQDEGYPARKELLGHRSIQSTLIYTQLVSFEGDEYHVKVAETVDEACELAKAGFDYFTTMDGIQVFRKRK